MFSKARIKLIVQLRQKKHREKNSMFIVEGSRNTLDFLNSDFKLIELFATTEWINSYGDQLNSINVTFVEKKDLKKISALTNPSEALAIFELPASVTSTELSPNKLSIALDDIHDPGNLGTIIRTADWFGINTIFCSRNSVDAFNPKVVQATMGSLARVSVHYTNLEELILNKPDGYPIFGAVLNGKHINEFGLQNSGLIVIGSEAHGIGSSIIPLINNKITIPLIPSKQSSKPESLNASVACSIICYALKISK